MFLSIISYITAVFFFLITAVFKPAFGHPGLEMRTLCYCTLCSTVPYPKAQPLIENASTCTPDMWTNLRDGRGNTGSHLWKFTKRRSTCRGLTEVILTPPPEVWLVEVCPLREQTRSISPGPEPTVVWQDVNGPLTSQRQKRNPDSNEIGQSTMCEINQVHGEILCYSFMISK